MITNIFGDPMMEHELVTALIDGSETEGEYISYSDDRGILSSLHIKPFQPNVIIQHDEVYGSSIYSINEVEEAVEAFMGYAEMHEMAYLQISDSIEG